MALRDNLKQMKEEQQENNTPSNAGLRGNVKKVVKKNKKEHFKWVKMWISYVVSMTMKDRGKIPDNIGDRILITNNLYITKLYMTTIIQITELGPNTPETMLEVLSKSLRDRGNRCLLDMSIKNTKYEYDPKNSGLRSRIYSWNRRIEDPETSRTSRERANRLLYTVSVAESGKQLKKSRIYLSLRSKDIMSLNAAEKIIFSVLNQMGCHYLPSYANVKDELEYISLLGNYKGNLKDVADTMTSNQVLAQILPNMASYNDVVGYYLGINILNGAPYYLDVNSITLARNMYCVAPSGVGKTVLALNMAQSAYENGSACCFMDIKGNEYTSFIAATDGYIVSLRPTSTEYINSWIMKSSDTTPENAEAYFKARVNFSKQQMIILSGITDRESLIDFEQLIDEFHDNLYVSIGAIPRNINSWKVTENLNPYVVFEKFESYLTPQKRSKYNISKSVMGVLRMYMSATGSKSYIFKREFDYAKILKSRTLSFDFGILSDQTISDVDVDLFRLKFLYMSKLNGDFVTKKYAMDIRTFMVLEESQVVSKEIMQMYVQMYTLRRSQNQDTLLLGNSVQALTSSDIAKPLIENTRGLFIGELTTDAREKVIEEFGLQHLKKYIKLPGSNVNYSNCFLFVNMMQKRELYPIIKVVIDPEFKKKYGKDKYKILTPVKEHNVMSGS